jgi:hypothetical protein
MRVYRKLNRLIQHHISSPLPCNFIMLQKPASLFFAVLLPALSFVNQA